MAPVARCSAHSPSPSAHFQDAPPFGVPCSTGCEHATDPLASVVADDEGGVSRFVVGESACLAHMVTYLTTLMLRTYSGLTVADLADLPLFADYYEEADVPRGTVVIRAERGSHVGPTSFAAQAGQVLVIDRQQEQAGARFRHGQPFTKHAILAAAGLEVPKLEQLDVEAPDRLSAAAWAEEAARARLLADAAQAAADAAVAARSAAVARPEELKLLDEARALAAVAVARAATANRATLLLKAKRGPPVGGRAAGGVAAAGGPSATGGPAA